MSSIPTPPTASPEPPPMSASAMDTIPSLPATAGKAIRELPRPAKFGIIGLLLILLVTWYIWLGRVSTDDAEVDAHITAVASQVSGYVVALPIDDNVNVKIGDVLVQIDPREYKAELDQAKAALDLAEAQSKSAELQIGLTRGTTTHSTGGAVAQHESDAADYAMSEAQLERTATANLLQAKAEVAAKRATNERAQADLERYKPLLQTNDVSKFQFDAVDATARVAQNDLAAAEQQLAAAQQNVEIARATMNSSKARVARSQSLLLESKAQEQQVPITEATYKSTEAAVERAKAVRDQAELNLDYTTIRAPISGQVTQLTVHLGQYVLPGNLLFTLVPLDQVYITANFKETQMKNVHPGQRAKIHVDTYDRDFDGVVDSIAGAAGSRQALLPPQNATGNFIKVVQRLPVKILVKQSSDFRLVLRPGMNVEATIYTR
ncbi:HlyD family secretion protein [Tunturiibacter lichenicola]|uniref:HlyD family secretion protein n=1 Tax=Tunturiibacter lichenicola TaxID=2051959 RepID=UPI003D9B96F7